MEAILSALNPVPLGRLAKSIRSFGAYSLTNQITYRPKGIPFLRGIDIKPGYIDFSSVLYIDQDAHAMLWKSKVEPGQVLFAMSGSVGNAAVSDLRWLYPMNSSQDLAKITLKDNLDPYFIATFLNSKYGRFQTKRLPVGSIQQHIFLWQTGMILVPILKRIQETVSKTTREAQSKLAMSQQKCEEAENLLLSDLGLLDWEPAHVLSYVRQYSEVMHARRLDTEHFQPKYEQLFSLINGFQPRRLSTLTRSAFKIDKVDPNKTYHYIEISDVHTSSGEVCFTDRAGKDLPPNAKIKVRGGELIISKVRPTRGAIGIVPVECSQDSICSSAFSIYEVVSPMREFIQVVLRSPVGKTQLERPSRGTSYPTIDDSDVGEILIPTVDQNAIETISSLVQQSQAARREAKSLLEKAKRAVEIAIEEGEERAIEFLDAPTKRQTHQTTVPASPDNEEVNK